MIRRTRMQAHPDRRLLRRPAGVTMLDGILGVLLISGLGMAILGWLSVSDRGAHALREEIILDGLLMDLLDELASGQARSLVSLPPGSDSTWSRQLSNDELSERLGTVPDRLPRSLRVTLSLSLLQAPAVRGRLRAGVVQVDLSWMRPDGKVRNLTSRAFTDSL